MARTSDVTTGTPRTLPPLSAACSRRECRTHGDDTRSHKSSDHRSRAFMRKYHLAVSAGRLRYAHSHRVGVTTMPRGKAKSPTATLPHTPKHCRDHHHHLTKNGRQSIFCERSSDSGVESQDEQLTVKCNEDCLDSVTVATPVHPLLNGAPRVSLSAAQLPYERRWLHLAPIATPQDSSTMQHANFGKFLPYLRDYQPSLKHSISKGKVRRKCDMEEELDWTVSSSMSVPSEDFRDGVRRAHEDIYLLRNLRSKSGKWSGSSSSSSTSSTKSKPMYPPMGLYSDNHSSSCPLCEVYTPSKEGHICPPNSPQLSGIRGCSSRTLDLGGSSTA